MIFKVILKCGFEFICKDFDYCSDDGVFIFNFLNGDYISVSKNDIDSIDFYN